MSAKSPGNKQKPGMVEYITMILAFNQQGEKTGWTYIGIPADIAQQLNPGFKKSFRVKGTLDTHPVEKAALLPMGQGSFILPVNAAMRKGLGKRAGAMVHVQLEYDERELEIDPELMVCLADDPEALHFFKGLRPSHQRYFSKWIETAKTIETRTRRLVQAVTALSAGQGYSEMMRALKNVKS